MLKCRGSEYASGSKYVKVLEIPQFEICQGKTGFRICLNNSWICLIMPECALICLSGFCFKFTHCNPLSKGTIEFSLKVKIWFFSIVAGSIWFCFRPNIFTSKVSNLLLSLGAEGSGCYESYLTSDIPNEYTHDAFLMIYLSILLLLFFLLLVLQGVNKRFTKGVIL